MTSMPASRSDADTTLAPRSCPSRPGLATRTRIGLDGLSVASAAAGMGAGMLCRPASRNKFLAEGGDVHDGAAVAAAVAPERIDQHRRHPHRARAHHVYRIDVTDVIRL